MSQKTSGSFKQLLLDEAIDVTTETHYTNPFIFPEAAAYKPCPKPDTPYAWEPVFRVFEDSQTRLSSGSVKWLSAYRGVESGRDSNPLLGAKLEK